MGKDKSKNMRSKGSNSWEMSNSSSGFIGFSAFTSNLSNATDPEFQIDSEYQVQFKKLSKKDAVSRLKALEELNIMFSKIDVESEDCNTTSIKALLSSWEIVFKRLVNDDDRKVREWSSICLGTLGSKVGKNLGPHLKTLFGPWLFSICDQKDQTYNTALQSFNNIFPEKKRKDVFKFAHDQALQYLQENLHETSQTLGDGKSIPPEVLQDRYERCISNSLLAIEYLIDNSTSAEEQETSSSTTQEIYQQTFEEQFFSFLSSKSTNIRKTCYRLIATIVNRVPSYSDNNLKDLSTKVLGIFSEKDPTTHLFMWDAIIAFLKKYNEKAWQGVDARKHVLPRFWAFLRNAAYGSHEFSYSMVLPFLSFIPESIIGDGIAFFQEFFGNMMKGLEMLENIKQLGSNERATTYLLTSYLECIVYSLKKYSNNQEIIKYLIGLLSDLLINYFGNEWNPFNDFGRLFNDSIVKLYAAKNENINKEIELMFNRLFDFTTRLLLEEIRSEANVADPKKQIITLPTLLNRYNKFLGSANAISQSLSKRLFLFTCQHFNNTNTKLQDNMFEMVAILLTFSNIQTLLEPEIKDTTEFINTSILPNIQSSLNQNNTKSVYNLFNIYQIIANDKNIQQDLTVSWQKLIEILKDQDVNYFIHLILQLNDRSQLSSTTFDELVKKLLNTKQSHNNPLYTTITINQHQHSLLSVLVSNTPLIKIETIDTIIQSLINDLKELVMTIVLNSGSSIEFSTEHITYATNFLFTNTQLSSELNNVKIKLLEEIIKSILHLHHQTQIDSTPYTEQLIQSIDTILLLPNNFVGTTLLPILFDNLITLKSPDFEFITELTSDIIIKDSASLNTLYSLYLLNTKKYQTPMNISWLQTDISPFKPTKINLKQQDLEIYFRIQLYIFDLLETIASPSLDVVQTILTSENRDQLVFDILTGLVAIDCSTQYTDTLLELQSKVSFKVGFIDDLVKSYSNVDDLIKSSWLQKTIKDSSESSNNTSIMVIRNITSAIGTSSSAELKQSFCSMVQTDYLASSLDGIVKSSRHLNLFQTILPILVELKSTFVGEIRQTLFKDLDSMSTSIPSDLDTTCFKLSLLCSIITQDDENEITETESHILLKILQIIQQWHLRSRSPIMQGQEINIDVIEIPLSQLFIIISQYVVRKSIYLSANQSQLIQSLLGQWSKSTEDESLLKRFNSLKIFNIILSNENNQKYILPNTSEEYLIEISSLFITQWIEGTKLITNKSFTQLYDLYSVTLPKIPKDIQFRIVQSNLKSIWALLLSEHTNVQRTAFLLLQSYFTNSTVELVKAYELSEDHTEYVIEEDISKLLNNFEIWKQLKNSKNDKKIIKKVVGHLMSWDLIFKNYAIQDFTKKSPINGYLNDKRKISSLLSCIFPVSKKEVEPGQFAYEEFPRSDDFNYPYIQTICGYLIYTVVENLPSMARSWWANDCNSKMSQQVDGYITRYISPMIIKHEIQLVNGHREPAGSNFTLRSSQSTKEVSANYEKDEMNISLSLQIPDGYPLRVLNAEFSKKVGVTEMQWRKWLLSMTSLLLVQDGTILDACLLWKSSLDKHFQGVEVCPICYSLFFNGTIPKFQCKNCKNKFHAGCIYKWFSTSHKSSCPLCTHNFN